MSRFSRFMKKNKIVRENVTYAATKYLLDENGEPVKFTIKPITTKEDNELRDNCTIDIPVTGKPNLYRPKLDTYKYFSKLLSTCIVEPNLYDAELQDSYEVKTPEDLIQEMIDDPGEFDSFINFVLDFNGLNKNNLEDKVDEAKN